MYITALAVSRPVTKELIQEAYFSHCMFLLISLLSFINTEFISLSVSFYDYHCFCPVNPFQN